MVATQYILAPDALWSALKQTGVPAANGYVFTYVSGTRIHKSTFLDPAGTTPQTNPIRLSSAGEATIYWEITSGAPLYTIEIYAASEVDGVPGQLIYTTDNYPSVGVTGGGAVITVNNDLDNYFSNEQFTWWTHGNSFSSADLIAGDTPIATAWNFRRGNTNATIAISQKTFAPETNPPPGTAPYYLEYECTVAASDSVNAIYQELDSVQTFANEQITVGFWARTRDPATVSTVAIFVEQYFGSGGSATPAATLYSKAIDDTWTYYSETFTVPTIVGKTIGTGGDDYLALGFQFQINQIIAIDITDVVVQEGAGTGINYPYRSQDQQYNALLQYILAGYDSDEGTNIIGWSETETLYDFLINLVQRSQFNNFLIGWNFVQNPNQFGQSIASVTDGTYICDQTILVSDGNGVVSKNSFIGQPLTLTVNVGATKFGIFQIIETKNSIDLQSAYASALCELKTSTSCTVKMAILGWSGATDAQLRDCVQSWNGAGVDPTLAAGWSYVSSVTSFTITALSEGVFNLLENQLMDTSSSFGLFIWVDSNTLGIGDTFTAYQGSLVLGANSSLAQTLDFEVVLAQCQRYYYRTYPVDTTTASGALTTTSAPSTMPPSGMEINGVEQLPLLWPLTYNECRISSTVACHFFPVELFKSPSVTVYNPFVGSTNTVRLYFDGGVLTAGTIDLPLTIKSTSTKETNFLIVNNVAVYNFSSGGGTVNSGAYYYHLIADARLGV